MSSLELEPEALAYSVREVVRVYETCKDLFLCRGPFTKYVKTIAAVGDFSSTAGSIAFVCRLPRFVVVQAWLCYLGECLASQSAAFVGGALVREMTSKKRPSYDCRQVMQPTTLRGAIFSAKSGAEIGAVNLERLLSVQDGGRVIAVSKKMWWGIGQCCLVIDPAILSVCRHSPDALVHVSLSIY